MYTKLSNRTTYEQQYKKEIPSVVLESPFHRVCTKTLIALLRYLNLTLSLFYLFFGKLRNIYM